MIPSGIEIIARAFIRTDNSVLLCRNVRRGYRFLPGGHVEPGESAASAVARELHEESGLEVRVGDLLLVSEALFDQGGKSRHEINLVFHVELPHQSLLAYPNPPISREPSIAFDWVPEPELNTSNFLPASVRDWVCSRLASSTPTPPFGSGWISEGFSREE